MIRQLEILVAANLLEWKELITEPEEQALAESWGDMKGYSGSSVSWHMKECKPLITIRNAENWKGIQFILNKTTLFSSDRFQSQTPERNWQQMF